MCFLNKDFPLEFVGLWIKFEWISYIEWNFKFYSYTFLNTDEYSHT